MGVPATSSEILAQDAHAVLVSCLPDEYPITRFPRVCRRRSFRTLELTCRVALGRHYTDVAPASAIIGGEVGNSIRDTP